MHPTSRLRSMILAGALASACAPPPAPAPAPAFSKRVEGSHGMVSASHADASAAGLEVLQAGGNAVDAAVAVAFALAVVDPSQTGLGAGGTMVAWHGQPARADAVLFYARTGADPAWAEADSAATRAPINGRAAGVPGAVAGLLEAHAKWGRLPRARVIAPAIRLASQGFTVSPLLANTTAASRNKLAADSAAAALFLPGGQPLRAGDRLVQPELAATLQAIANSGTDAFYQGPVAERAVARMRSRGSVVTLADWQGYRPLITRPLCTPWNGFTVLSAPPPMGGVTVLEALNVLSATNARQFGSPTVSGQAALAMLGAMRVAEADRRQYRGDPSIYAVPARGMATPAFASSRAPAAGTAPGVMPPAGDPWAIDQGAPGGACDRLDPWPASALGPERAAAVPDTSGSDDAAASNTSHFSVVDADRNAVSVTFTVGVLFGSGVYASGFFLNSGANNFDAQTRGPSRFSSSTIAPSVVLEGDAVRLVVGAAGSQYIPTATTQVTWRTLVLGEDPWLAIAAPRLQPGRGGSGDIEMEPGFAPEVYQTLRERGYRPTVRDGQMAFGGVHAVYVTPKGRLIGVADPRRDGAAMGW
jgi:gamma-glutamyltranspeptidase/glutathione hydrolase